MIEGSQPPPSEKVGAFAGRDVVKKQSAELQGGISQGAEAQDWS